MLPRQQLFRILSIAYKESMSRITLIHRSIHSCTRNSNNLLIIITLSIKKKKKYIAFRSALIYNQSITVHIIFQIYSSRQQNSIFVIFFVFPHFFQLFIVLYYEHCIVYNVNLYYNALVRVIIEHVNCYK